MNNKNDEKEKFVEILPFSTNDKILDEKIFSIIDDIKKKLPKGQPVEAYSELISFALNELTDGEISELLFDMFHADESAMKQISEKLHIQFPCELTPSQQCSDLDKISNSEEFPKFGPDE
jgi:hypothetical protein